MKNQALFSLKDKSKKLKCRLLQFLFGGLRVSIVAGFTPSSRIPNDSLWNNRIQSIQGQWCNIRPLQNFPKGELLC